MIFPPIAKLGEIKNLIGLFSGKIQKMGSIPPKCTKSKDLPLVFRFRTTVASSKIAGRSFP